MATRHFQVCAGCMGGHGLHFWGCHCSEAPLGTVIRMS